MSEYRDTLERELERLQPPRIAFEQLEGRRDHRRREQRVRAAVLGLAIALAVGWWGFHAIRATDRRPADDTKPIPAPELRHDGEFFMFEPKGAGRGFGEGWDLAAQDPETGEVRKIVETDGIADCAKGETCTTFVKEAEWSSDGRWIAFEVTNASLDGPSLGPCGPTIGLWVQNATGEPRQLTTPCNTAPAGANNPIQEMWEWSPVGARVAYARIDGKADELIVIDPSDGSNTSLVTGNIAREAPPTLPAWALEWSPDSARIAYADGDAVYVVAADGGEPSLLAESFHDIFNIAWSPDGSHILVQDRNRSRLQVVNADGSVLHVVLEGDDACCDETAWSPNGDRIVYQRSVVRPGQPEFGLFDSEVWTISPDGTNPIKVFGTDGDCDNQDALPVWAPNGTQVAYVDCGVWMLANADGTGEARPIDDLLWRSWYSSGLSQWDLAGVGQVDH